MELAYLRAPANTFAGRTERSLLSVNEGGFTFKVFDRRNKFTGNARHRDRVFRGPLVTCRASSHHRNDLRDKCSFLGVGGRGTVLHYYGLTRSNSKVVIHMGRNDNRTLGGIRLAFTTEVLRTDRYLTGRRMVGGTSSGNGGLGFSLTPCNVGAFHVGLRAPSGGNHRGFGGLSLRCGSGNFAGGRDVHGIVLRNDNYSLPTRLYPRNFATNNMDFGVPSARTSDSIVITEKRAVSLPGDVAGLCVTTTSALNSESTAFCLSNERGRVGVTTVARRCNG